MRTHRRYCAAALVLFVTFPVAAKISENERIAHALNRLTFGPRPADVEAVRKTGLKKWIDQQLHPERIAENPVLEAKLRPIDTLSMSPAEMVRAYPPPQLIRGMAEGRVPYPSDPKERERMKQLAAVYEQRRQTQADSETGPEMARSGKLRDLLTADELRTLRDASPEERRAIFESWPPEKRTQVMAALPRNPQRRGLAGSPEERREMLASTAPIAVVGLDLNEAKIYRAVYGNRQLEEVLTDFWFNHFNVFFDKGADRLLVTSYERDAIRPHVLLKFHDLLLATAQHPAMLFYLDNWQSAAADARLRGRRSKGLNENYARELMELHTLGVDGGYTQKDVTEVARCFTGWTLRNPRAGGGFTFEPRMHDRGEKTVLGVRIPAGGGKEDGLKVLEILANHPSTARFVSHKLAQRFVADEPPAKLVDRMARTFEKSHGDLREVMKAMLDSQEFWSDKYYRAKMKSPLEMVVSAVRAVNAEVESAIGLAQQIAQMGQPLYRKQEPTGYSNTSEDWVSSAGLLARMNFAAALMENRVPGVRVEAGVKPTLGPLSRETQSTLEKAEPEKITSLLLGSPEFQRR
jgi:uncharacterized protein (DUF1800 family)